MTERVGILASLREDIATARAHDPASRSAAEVALAYSGLHAIWGYRLMHRLWESGEEYEGLRQAKRKESAAAA